MITKRDMKLALRREREEDFNYWLERAGWMAICCFVLAFLLIAARVVVWVWE